MLAVKIGLNEAIVLQQLHYLLRNPKFGKRIADHQWIFNTYEEWRAQFFPFWSCETIKRIFARLASLRLVAHCQPEGRASRRKYYRVDYGRLALISEQVNLTSSNRSICAVPYTKTTANSLKKTKEDIFAENAHALWKPDERTKEEKLRTTLPPEDYPSEREFENFLVDHCPFILSSGRGDEMYRELCNHKWCQWKPHVSSGKWVRIRSWRRYVKAFDQKLETAAQMRR